MTPVSVVWGLSAVLLVGCASEAGHVTPAASGAVSCPATIQTNQQLTRPAAPPWASLQLGGSSHLLFAELYDGPPRDEQIIMADEHRDEPGRELLTWRFRGQPAKQGTWLLCSYQNTQVKLEMRLPETVTECVQASSTDASRVVRLLSQVCR